MSQDHRNYLNRRSFIRLGAMGTAGTLLAACAPQVVEPTAESPTAAPEAAEPTIEVQVPTANPNTIEKFAGASLIALMRQCFIPEVNNVQGAIATDWANKAEVNLDISFPSQWRELTAAGVESKSGVDIASLFANATYAFADNLVDVSDIAEELGSLHGGWYPAAMEASVVDGVWRSIPYYTAHAFNYRTDVFEAVGASSPPATYDELLDIGTRIKEARDAGEKIVMDAETDAAYEMDMPLLGFTVSQTGPNDSASFCYSLLWSFGGYEVDEDGATVAINSDGTRAALKYIQQLAEVSDPGFIGFDEGANNRAFQGGLVSATQNATSIYWNVLKGTSPVKANQMGHFRYPAGPAEQAQMLEMNAFGIFSFTESQDAAKAFLRYMLAERQFTPFLQQALTFYTPMLYGYDDNPVMPWNTDPKLAQMKNLGHNGHLPGWPGPASSKAQEAYSRQTIVNMFAAVATGGDIEDAVSVAEEELKAVYEA